jgi:hypothetical protein
MKTLGFSISRPVLSELLTGVLVNLSSGWLGVLLISPGLFQVSTFSDYLWILIVNLPFAIVSFTIAYWLKINWE